MFLPSRWLIGHWHRSFQRFMRCTRPGFRIHIGGSSMRILEWHCPLHVHYGGHGQEHKGWYPPVVSWFWSPIQYYIYQPHKPWTPVNTKFDRSKGPSPSLLFHVSNSSSSFPRCNLLWVCSLRWSTIGFHPLPIDGLIADVFFEDFPQIPTLSKQMSARTRA